MTYTKWVIESVTYLGRITEIITGSANVTIQVLVSLIIKHTIPKHLKGKS